MFSRAWCLLAFLVIGCGGVPNEEEGIPVIPLDFYNPPEDMKILSQTEVEARINETTDFYLNLPSRLPQGTDDEPLLECLLKDMKVAANENVLTVQGTSTKGYCFERYDDGLPAQAVVIIDFQVRCDDGDLSRFDKEKVRDIDGFFDEDFGTACESQVDIIGTIDAEVSLDGSFRGKRYEIVYNWKFGKSEPDSRGFCELRRENGKIYDHGCAQATKTSVVKYSVNGISNAEELVSDYQKLTSVKLEGNDDGTSAFYNAGKFNIEFNNWKGTMDYLDAVTKPFYDIQTEGRSPIRAMFSGKNEDNL
ncbi:MAG: hypothetical protein AB7T49_07745 [Oligoflexales bacterium]